MGLTAAIKDGITFENGKAIQNNFNTYRVLRMHEMPEIEVYIVQNEEAPGGVGEPGLPPVAPALTNAIFSLTGKRIRKLPFNLEKV
jgi:isoquinoline 1-oxidoreductase beta subunit